MKVEIVNGVDDAENKLSSIKKSFTVAVDKGRPAFEGFCSC